MKERMPDSTESQIIDHMRSVDRKRKKYCAYYTDTVFGMAEYYDLTLSSSAFSTETCVDIICELAQK